MAKSVYMEPTKTYLSEGVQCKGKTICLSDNRVNFMQQNNLLEKMEDCRVKTIQGFGLRIGGDQDVFGNEISGVGDVYDVNIGIKVVAGLASLGMETLYILAHGIPRLGTDESKVAGYTPKNFVELLLRLGYNPANHQGLIDFKSCTAGWSRLNQPSFAEKVAMILWGSHQFKGSVSGVTGFSVVQGESEDEQRKRNPALPVQPLRRWQDFGIYRQINALQTYCSVLHDKLDVSGGVVTSEIEFGIAIEEARQYKELNKLKLQTPEFSDEIDHVKDEIIRIMDDFRKGNFGEHGYSVALDMMGMGELVRLKLTLQDKYLERDGYHRPAEGSAGVLCDEERITYKKKDSDD